MADASSFLIFGQQKNHKIVVSKKCIKLIELRDINIFPALREFLAFRGPDVHVIIDELLDQLETVRDAASLGVYHIFSSSLLIAYEADREAAPRAEIRLVALTVTHKIISSLH